ncbi:MAG: hypothetical protein R3240_00655 [Gammaproteobacteria bacterium]|nr:hypothetical protein [Gammaproteobacteria bacterium]
MTSIENPLGLFIPSQSIEYSDAPYLKPKEAERWIASLPTAHIGETARLIYKAMAEINRVALPAKNRFQILELFREPLEYVTESLLKHFVGQAFPLSPKTQKIAELTMELQWEIANGYKIIIDNRISGIGTKIDDKTLLTSIYRAMNYLSANLYKSYLIYAPANNQAWLELNHLYLFAETNSLISDPVKDPMAAPGELLTISNLFKKTVLLAIANPYRLSQFDIIKVNKHLNEWARLTHLHVLENINTPIGLFTIDLEKNTPPSYYSSNKAENSQYTRVLDSSELTRIIRSQIDSHEDDDDTGKPAINSDELSNETLKRLLLAWGAVPKRNFSRKGCKEKAKAALGLNATHFFITRQLESQEEMEEGFTDSQIAFSDKANFLANPAPDTSKPPIGKNSQHDVWDLASNPNLSKSEFELPSFGQFEMQLKAAAKGTNNNEIYDCYDCLLVNESAGGFCVSWETSESTRLIVGSLVSIRNVGSPQNEWNIGVIRWIKTSENNGMYLGIELISPQAQPIATKNLTQKNLSDSFSRSLLLPELRSVKQPQTLITQSIYRVGDKLELDIHGQSIKVKLTKLVESTSTFGQFQFSIIRTVKKVTEQDKMDRIKNFDSIWSSI